MLTSGSAVKVRWISGRPWLAPTQMTIQAARSQQMGRRQVQASPAAPSRTGMTPR